MTASWDDEGFYEALFGVGKSRRYHAYMREFYQRLADWTLAAQALSGTSAFVALLPANANAGAAKFFAAIVAVASILDLVFRFSRKADIHDRLCRSFTELAADIAGLQADSVNLGLVCARRLKLEVDEPTERRLVDLKAQNDEYSARGIPLGRRIPLSSLQRSWLSYFITFGEEGIRCRMEERDKGGSK